MKRLHSRGWLGQHVDGECGFATIRLERTTIAWSFQRKRIIPLNQSVSESGFPYPYPGLRSVCIRWLRYLLLAAIQFHLSSSTFAQLMEDNDRHRRGGDCRLLSTNKAVFTNGSASRVLDLDTGKLISTSLGNIPSQRAAYTCELANDEILHLLSDRWNSNPFILVKLTADGKIQSHVLQLASSYEFAGIIEKRFAMFGDEEAYVAIDCGDLAQGAVNESLHTFSRSELKSDAKSYLAQFQVIPGTSSIIEVSQVGNAGRASVIECNFQENKLRGKASWDAVFFDSHGGLSVSREDKRGAIHIWTLLAKGDQLECHTLLGELVQSHRLPQVTLGGCTWGPNRWNVEGNAKTLTGIHLRDHCEWHFDFANNLAPLPTNFGKRLIGRIQGDSAKFMILETYTDGVCTISMPRQQNLWVVFGSGRFPSW